MNKNILWIMLLSFTTSTFAETHFNRFAHREGFEGHERHSRQNHKTRFQGMTDYDVLALCYLSKKSSCKLADIDGDRKVDASDYRLLRSFSIYDIDTDGVIATSSDYGKLQSCYGMDPAIESSCATSDLDGDGIVGSSDLLLFSSAVENANDYDLNHDGVVDYTIYGDGAEITAFRACYFQQATDNVCAVWDFNHDGIINSLDLLSLRITLQSDLNKDGRVEFSNDGADYRAVVACMGSDVTGNCLAADLNKDGSIDTSDLSVMSGFSQLDINNDLILDFTTNTAPSLITISKEINEGDPLSFYIYFNGSKEPILSFDNFIRVPYGLGNLTSGSEKYGVDFQKNLPAGAKLHEVIYGDLNGDNELDEKDLRKIQEMLREDHGHHASIADLNNDGVVDQSDAGIIESRIAAGTRNNAYYFEWKRTNNGAGLYLLDIGATDWTNRHNSDLRTKFKVYDSDRPLDYYGHDDVLVVINNNSAISKQIGEYFIAQRNIPLSHVVYIDAPVKETINPEEFTNTVRAPIEAYLKDNNIVTDINYIVTTKGVPLRYYGSSSINGLPIMRSVDSLLTTIAGGYAPYIDATTDTGYFYSLSNPYWLEHTSNKPFSKKQFDIYLVTRLTGYTFEDVKRMIDNAANPASGGNFVLDVDPSKDGNVGYKYGNDQLRSAAAILQAKGESVILDETTAFLTNQTDVLGYFSWGSNDAYDTNNGIPNNSWLPGAIADTYVSTSARTFNYPATYGQSLIADLIAEGITGVMGYAFEPSLGGVSKPDILFDKYTNGFVLADSFYGAYVAVNHTGVIVGDPKTAIRKTFP